MLAFYALASLLGGTVASADASMSNLIGRVARIFNPKLVKMEGRVEFLNSQLMSLAMHKEHSLGFGIGCRGAQLKKSDPLPSLTVDLGKQYSVESLFLVPLLAGAGDSGDSSP